MRAMRGFDFIFCRNVLIYFDDLSRKSVVDHFYNALNPRRLCLPGAFRIGRTGDDGFQAEDGLKATWFMCKE